MKLKIRYFSQVISLSFIIIVFFSSNSIATETQSSDPNRYLNAVREFADNVLEYGRDTYGPKQTPLFVDGLNIHTHEPVKWIAPFTMNEEWILSNFASQQTLLRTLDGLSAVTGDSQYRDAAEEVVKYAFENLRAPNGLFYWGQELAYDLLTDEVKGGGRMPSMWHHTLKAHYPHYQLMWDVDQDKTKEFIDAYWSGHVLDWSNLDMARGIPISQTLDSPSWDSEYNSGPAFFDGKDLCHIHTASSIIQAGVFLHIQSNQEQPLIWGERLLERYVNTRDPNTGIATIVYNELPRVVSGDLRERFGDKQDLFFPFDMPKTGEFYWPEKTQAHSWIAFLLAYEMMGAEDKLFAQTVLEELTAWGKVAYRKEDNTFIPMFIDGTSLEGYVSKSDQQMGVHMQPKGVAIKPYDVDSTFLWAYTLAYRITGDEFMWAMVRDIARGNNLGDIAETPREAPQLDMGTQCADAYALLGVLELYAKTNKPEFLSLARRIADNILENKFHEGFVVLSKQHIYSKFDSLEPLALLHLVAALESKQEAVPRAWPNSPLFVPRYRFKEKAIDRQLIYTLTESSQPPFSLQEVAFVGNINAVRSLIEQGEDVNGRESETPIFRTALHYAVMRGHRDVVELLLEKGADTEVKGYLQLMPLLMAVDNNDELPAAEPENLTYEKSRQVSDFFLKVLEAQYKAMEEGKEIPSSAEIWHAQFGID